MHTENARVVAVQKNTVLVAGRELEQCSSCAAKKSCGHHLFFRNKEPELIALHYPLCNDECDLENQQKGSDSIPATLQKGDFVQMLMPDNTVLQLCALFYLLPLAGLLLGSSIAYLLVSTELVSILLGAAGLILGIVTLRAVLDRNAVKEHFLPELQPGL